MRIFILEDDPRVRSIADELRKKGHIVDFTPTLPGMYWYLNEEPGIQAYEAILLDLTVPGVELEIPGGEKLSYNAPMGLNGLQFFLDKYESLFKPHERKIAFFSAYLPSAARIAEDQKKLDIFNSIKKLNKNDDDIVSQLLNWLDELSKNSPEVG